MPEMVGAARPNGVLADQAQPLREGLAKDAHGVGAARRSVLAQSLDQLGRPCPL